jgi:hypothetical protein
VYVLFVAILFFPYHFLFLYVDFDVVGASEKAALDFCVDCFECLIVYDLVLLEFFRKGAL